MDYFPLPPYSPHEGLYWDNPREIPHEIRDKYKSDPEYRKWRDEWKKTELIPTLRKIIKFLIGIVPWIIEQSNPTYKCYDSAYEPHSNYLKSKAAYQKKKEEEKLKKEEEKLKKEEEQPKSGWEEFDIDVDHGPEDLNLDEERPKVKVTFNNT